MQRLVNVRSSVHIVLLKHIVNPFQLYAFIRCYRLMIRDNCFVRLLAFFTYIVLLDSLLSSSSFFAVCELAMSTFITYVFSLLLFPLCPFFILMLPV